MESLSQELVQAIVREIDHIPSLRTCALAGSIFRHASQRVLFRSLALQIGANAQAAHRLLMQSPHIAIYVKRLSITLEGMDVDGDNLEQSLQQILDRLVNVRQCNTSLRFLRHISTSLFDFLARQPLHKLNIIESNGVPPAAILRLLTTAPVVSFIDVFVEKEPFPLDNPEYNPQVEELLIGTVNPKFYEPLAHPPLASTLRHLSILETYGAWPTVQIPQFMSIAAPTLEDLYLGGLTHHLILPALPSLRTITFRVWLDNWSPWLLVIISSVVRTSRLLAAIPISFSCIFHTHSDFSFASAEALTTLDVALAAQPGHPVIRYSLDFRPTPAEDSACAKTLADFSVSIQTGMPKTHEQGGIIIEV
ncbi:hypothetical protein C8R45DRAFT_1221929 [Mycena sanguinolenta]|nr:hypothetical protein C8R45DRAFT_1221929 [Mycena sanguinolenta]